MAIYIQSGQRINWPLDILGDVGADDTVPTFHLQVPGWGKRREISSALDKAQSKITPELEVEVFKACVSGWSWKTANGQDIPCPTDADGVVREEAVWCFSNVHRMLIVEKCLDIMGMRMPGAPGVADLFRARSEKEKSEGLTIEDRD